MGYTTRNNGAIRDFWPDNSEYVLYIRADSCSFVSLEDLRSKIESHFGDIDWSMLSIASENIHTYCITYDLHDPSDYTNFIVIRKL